MLHYVMLYFIVFSLQRIWRGFEVNWAGWSCVWRRRPSNMASKYCLRWSWGIPHWVWAWSTCGQ